MQQKHDLMKRIFFITLLIWASNALGQSDFQNYFDSLGVRGSTTIYDYNNKNWIYTNQQDAETTSLPASTFKILHSLIALETKGVQDENEILTWDGKPKSHLGNEVKVWNKDTDLKQAYKNSTIWFYEEVAERIGRMTYISILNGCGYGNGNFSEAGKDFWNYGGFAISPVNQIEFLIKLYEGNLPFSESTLDKVRQIMISEKTETQIFRDKTGWTRKDQQDIGWWVGYLEIGDNVYFFATRLVKEKTDQNPHFLNGRKAITKLILKDLIG